MLKRGILPACFSLLVLMPAPALACRSAEQMAPLLHTSLNVVPQGAVAANVQILNVGVERGSLIVEARIISMLRGSYPGQRIKIQTSNLDSCDGIPRTGDKGIFMGRVVSASGDVLLLDPISAPSDYEQRLKKAQ